MIAIGATADAAVPCPTAPVVRLVARSADPSELRPCMRAARLAGRHVILTIGGIGTRWRRPSAEGALRLIRSLPSADEYSWVNEVDLNGWPTARAYRRGWRFLRRSLGRKLGWCDCSSWFAYTWTRAAGGLPRNTRFFIHPYQNDDPLAPSRERSREGHVREAGLGSLRRGIPWRITELGAHPENRPGWWWPRALQRIAALRVPYVVAYTACGSTWCSVGP